MVPVGVPSAWRSTNGSTMLPHVGPWGCGPSFPSGFRSTRWVVIALPWLFACHESAGFVPDCGEVMVGEVQSDEGSSVVNGLTPSEVASALAAERWVGWFATTSLDEGEVPLAFDATIAFAFISSGTAKDIQTDAAT